MLDNGKSEGVDHLALGLDNLGHESLVVLSTLVIRHHVVFRRRLLTRAHTNDCGAPIPYCPLIQPPRNDTALT